MPEERNKDAMWYVLDKIQKDLDKIDEKWDKHILGNTHLSHELRQVTTKVNELNKLLTYDNGKPSVITQLRDISGDVNSLKHNIDAIKNDLEAVKIHVGIKDPAELRLERMKTAGKVIGVISLTLPGILSFLTGMLAH